MNILPWRLTLSTATALGLAFGLSAGHAATPEKKPAPAAATTAKKPAPTRGKKPAPPPKAVEPPPPAEADDAQIDAAERVYYGMYDCEFKQSVDIVASPRFKAYVDVKHGKSAWVMKPVLSSTGAIRLEDVRGETLMVQIASKSMLLNVKTGQRIVDECVSPKQRELIEAARVKAAEAAQAASAPAVSASAASGVPNVSVPTPVAPGASAAK